MSSNGKTQTDRPGWPDFVDPGWLAKVHEQAIDPDIPLVDPHHHLWRWPFPYERQALLDDLQSGHNVVATVHTEAHGHYRTEGPPHLKPVGETEYLVGTAEANTRDGGRIRICAGIIGGGDLTADSGKVEELLDAHILAGKGRFSGIRANVFVAFDERDGALRPAPGWEELVDSNAFREGRACLARRNLALDLVILHTQLQKVARLAQDFPSMPVVVNHLAILFTTDSSTTADLQAAWRQGIDRLAPHSNIYLKLGGCANPMLSAAMPLMKALKSRPTPPTSEELAAVYRPQVSYAIDKLGPNRCMFESNFPVDKSFTSYVVLWNAFKRLAAPYSADERLALLGGSAARAYRLNL
jgi:predicted TIM-barrel fold metal-dependent hydrolase